WIDRWAARTPPDAVVANSRFTAESAGRVFPGVAASVVYPPVPAPGPPDRAARERARAQFDTPGDAAAILTVGRIEELKGHAALLDALGRLRELPGWVCWLVGGAQRPHEVELLAGQRSAAGRLGIAGRVR